MTTSRIAALLLTCTLVGVGAVVTAPAANAAPGWTKIRSDYAVDTGDPTFRWCEVSETKTKVTLKIRAARPRAAVLSQAVNWTKNQDYTGPSGNAFGDTWTNNVSVVRLTLPRRSFLTISWQTKQAGHAFTGTRSTPLGLARCP